MSMLTSILKLASFKITRYHLFLPPKSGYMPNTKFTCFEDTGQRPYSGKGMY